MATGTEILNSKEWQNASPEERQVIFARKVAKDPDYANESAEVQKAIQDRFFGTPAASEAKAQESSAESSEVESGGFVPYPPLQGGTTPSTNQDKKKESPFRKDTLLMSGAAFGATVPMLLQKYLASPDKLQRDLYEKAIKNALAESGIDVAGFKGADLIAEARRFVSQQPLAAEEKLAGLKAQVEELRALQPPVSTGFPSPLDQSTGRVEPTLRASGPKVEGASGVENWMRSQAGRAHQVPDVLLGQATDMTKTSETGAKALIDKDLRNLEKIKQLGGGDYQLAGKGPGQLMLPPEVGAQKMSREAQVAREALAIILPQISALESQIARLQARGQDVSNLIAQLEELRRAEGSARQITKGMRVPPQAGLSFPEKMAVKMRPTTMPQAGASLAGHTLAGVGAGLNIGTALDESEDPITRTLAGISGAFDVASMAPPYGYGIPAKGIGTLGGLAMLPVQAGYEALAPETKEKIRKRLGIPFKSVMDKK